ncbi:hypothetical protein HNP36_001420 [Chryseobacterium shigense]|uniref:Uncharacterized protein n=1 Tax=Chryseobacterium shigense TaxID=297244 RepID=A0A841N1R2_9FLAO|nr:hypothetical protein [Chryseobacterium shigense]
MKFNANTTVDLKTYEENHYHIPNPAIGHLTVM